MNFSDEVALKDVSEYSKEKIDIGEISISNYVSTENLVPDIGGKVLSSGLPSKGKATKYCKGDILISNIRPYFKKIWQADNDGGSSNDVLVLKAKRNIEDKFLYYNLACSEFFDYVMTGAKGTKMPRGDKNHILGYKLNLPPLEEQRAIAQILSTLDDKIEVNNQINKTLENMAKAIFKEWFVDFEFPNEDGEPYKTSGGELVESELGMIPKGWKVSTLKDVINIIDNRGKTPPQEPNKTIYPIIDVKALSGDIRVIDYNNCMKYVSKETYENWFRSGHPSQGDILLSTVGSLAELKIFMGSTGCIAQNVVALRAKTISNLYLFELLKNIKNDLVSYNIGSVQPSIKVTHIVKHKILIPNNIIVEKFHHLIDRITNKIFVKHNENVLLTSMRDSLIPKLMSGEIRVPCLLDGAGKPCDEEGVAS